MSGERRLRPPKVELVPELEWLLQASFASSLPSSPSPRATLTVELALELELGARIATRLGSDRLGQLLHSGEFGSLLAERARALRAAERILGALETVAAIAERTGGFAVPLKLAAQLLAADSVAGARGSGDLDLLLSESQFRAWSAGLLEEGWQPAAKGSEPHEAGSFFHPTWGPLDLHRNLPGVRVNDTPSATFEALQAAGLLENAPASGSSRILVPKRPVRLAHAVVHGFCQHEGSFHRFAPLRFLADAADIGLKSQDQDWIRAQELAAPALAANDFWALRRLLHDLAAGQIPAAATREGLWLRHLLAAAQNPNYQQLLLRQSLLRLPIGDQRFRYFVVHLWRAAWPDAARLNSKLGPAQGILARVLRRFRHFRELARKLWQRHPKDSPSGSS